MKRWLAMSNYPTRLNNIKLSLLIFPIFILILTAIFRGIIFAGSIVDDSDTTEYLNNLIYGVGSLNDQQTFPPKIITLTAKDYSEKFFVFSNTVGEALDELEIEMDLDDMANPPEESTISDGSVIQIIKVDVEFIKKTEDIPFATKEVETDTLDTGSIQVQREGVMGIREKVIKVISQDDVVVRSETESSTIVLEPIIKILLIGTKPTTIQDCLYWDAVIDRIVPKTQDPTKNNWMKYIMRTETWCDSGQNTRNTYFGLYQFLISTYIANGGSTWWDGSEQIKVVSRMFDKCQQGQWGPYRNSTLRVMSFMERFPLQYSEIEKACGR